MRIFLSSLIAIFLIATPASAQTVEKLNVENVGAALSHMGLRYIVSVDNRGLPALQVDGTALGANNFNVFFYSCTEAVPDQVTECDDIALWSWYDAGRLTIDQVIHGWNDIRHQSRNWSRAYVDQDGDPALVMNINAYGGLGINNLQIMVNTYLSEAQDFSTLVRAN